MNAKNAMNRNILHDVEIVIRDSSVCLALVVNKLYQAPLLVSILRKMKHDELL